MQTNLKSAFIASQTAGRYMKDHGGGKIINISSVGGHTALRTERGIRLNQSGADPYDENFGAGMGKVRDFGQCRRPMVFPDAADRKAFKRRTICEGHSGPHAAQSGGAVGGGRRTRRVPGFGRGQLHDRANPPCRWRHEHLRFLTNGCCRIDQQDALAGRIPGSHHV